MSYIFHLIYFHISLTDYFQTICSAFFLTLRYFPKQVKSHLKPFVSKLDEVNKEGKNEKSWEIYVKQTISITGNNNVIVSVKVNFAVAADSKNLWKESWSYKHVRFGSYVEVLFTGRRRGQGLLLKLWDGNGDLYAHVQREQEKNRRNTSFFSPSEFK